MQCFYRTGVDTLPLLAATNRPCRSGNFKALPRAAAKTLVLRSRSVATLFTSSHFRMAPKRKDPPTKAEAATKKPRPEVPEYHLTPTVTDDDGSIQWPAPKAQIDRARQIILEWRVSSDQSARIYC